MLKAMLGSTDKRDSLLRACKEALLAIFFCSFDRRLPVSRLYGNPSIKHWRPMLLTGGQPLETARNAPCAVGRESDSKAAKRQTASLGRHIKECRTCETAARTIARVEKADKEPSRLLGRRTKTPDEVHNGNTGGSQDPCPISWQAGRYQLAASDMAYGCTSC